jgi:RNA polymerase sigma factor for flagellar operon FliA
MLPVVERIAKSIARRLPSFVDLDDLIGAGHVGLMTAMRRSAGMDDDSFVAYAVTRIRGEILDEVRRMDRLSRRQRERVRLVEQARHELRAVSNDSIPPAVLAERAGLSAAEYQKVASLRAAGQPVSLQSTTDAHMFAAQVWDAVDDAVDAKRRLRRVQRAAEALPERLHRVVTMSQRGVTLKHIGAELGVSEARACQLRKEAVHQLRIGADVSSIAPPSGRA